MEPVDLTDRLLSGDWFPERKMRDDVGGRVDPGRVEGGGRPGENVGVIDTSAPYAVKLDTTKLPDGTVTLTAVASDAAGNHTTSTPVTVSRNGRR